MSYIFSLGHQHGLTRSDMQRLLGGKGFGLSLMASELDLPVPPGFTISTDACKEYLANGWPDGLDDELRTNLGLLEDEMGRRLGDHNDPLLVSVRSGAPVSMPGMMDTILNLGLTSGSVAGLARVTGDDDFATDCHTRFLTMFRSTVGMEEVPDDPWEQLRLAIGAVFSSWNSDRAITYRNREGIADQIGTAVTVQAMVFGNRGPASASGVLFTRDPATGSGSPYGDLLFGAQGEDVVAGTHQTLSLSALDQRLPAVGEQLRKYARILEHHHRDLCDIEFTIEDGELWMLQVRVGKRSPEAAVRIALEMAEDEQFPLTMEEAVQRVRSHLSDPPSKAVERPVGSVVLTTGLGASPGLASGEIVIRPDHAEQIASAGRPVILVRPETSPADVHGMTHAEGILTASGGVASHAAVVARGWGIPAVVGAVEVQVGVDGIMVGDTALEVGAAISIDGSSGEVFIGNVTGRTETVPEALTLLRWASELGIEIHDDTDTQPVDPPQTESPLSSDDVIGVMAIKGFVSADSVSKATMSGPDSSAEVLDSLLADGLVEGAGPMLRLSEPGRLLADQLLAHDRSELGEEVARIGLDDFLPLDQRLKSIVTRWQLKESADGSMTTNEHGDAAYDTAVMADLVELAADAAVWIVPLAERLSRLLRYRIRVDVAMQQVVTGDHRFIASPAVDSVHSVWFEIHEDLIRLAGTTRADETAAGRA